ncbi:MAG: DNA methyltransferase, partial [Anaerolineae bacterium]
VTRWDGRTTRRHPVTGEQVPDETARVPAWRYLNPRPAAWPQADFVVGNPPFIGNWRMRGFLGDGYVEALRAAYSSVPGSADYVMFWWDKAAELVRTGKIRRFGFITTNSLRQPLNRQVLEHYINSAPQLSLVFAIPDHPWVDSADGAAVRVAMTVAEFGDRSGVVCEVTGESSGVDGEITVQLRARSGVILSDLNIGVEVGRSFALRANSAISNTGVKLHGAGFLVTPSEAASLGLGSIIGLERHIRHYRNGRDIAQTSRGLMVIDLDGLTAEEVRQRFPAVYQRVLERVKPERDQNQERYRRENWWLFGRKNTELRSALRGLHRYIATVETSKHRLFVFLDAAVLPDNKLINIALDDAYFLGVLCSRIHVTWAMRAGSRLEDRPVYVKTTCFEKFPFPDAIDAQKARIRSIAEELDSHRKRQQALHPKLTLTDMYNVLARLRASEALAAKDKVIHGQGLVSILRQLHDDLDAAVAEAYGWPADLPDEEILARLVALNAGRAAEEAAGIIRWLRPDYQSPAESAPQAQQAGFEIEEPETRFLGETGFLSAP